MNNKYTIYYYRSPSGDTPIEKFLDSLSEKQQVKILRLFQYVNLYGLSTILPHTKKLSGTPLWEMRILGKDSIRILYAIIIENTILMLHGFIKKSQKTPTNDLHIAFNRYSEWMKRNR